MHRSIGMSIHFIHLCCLQLQKKILCMSGIILLSIAATIAIWVIYPVNGGAILL